MGRSRARDTPKMPHPPRPPPSFAQAAFLHSGCSLRCDSSQSSARIQHVVEPRAVSERQARGRRGHSPFTCTPSHHTHHTINASSPIPRLHLPYGITRAKEARSAEHCLCEAAHDPPVRRGSTGRAEHAFFTCRRWMEECPSRPEPCEYRVVHRRSRSMVGRLRGEGCREDLDYKVS